MTIKAIHQFTGIARKGDGIFDYATELQGMFRNWGYQSHIYVLDEPGPGYDDVYRYKNYRPNKGDLLFYQFGIGSKLTDFVIKQPAPKILIYQGMTPGKYLLGVDNNSFLACRRGRGELDRLRDNLTAAMSVSDDNINDLKENHGYGAITKVPLLKRFDAYEGREPSPERMAKWQSDKKTIFFIGRINPNKDQAGLIETLAAYKKLYGDTARLIIPGSWKDKEGYRDHLRELIKRNDLEDSVIMPGFIDDEDFFALFRQADVYLSLSEHEGFGVPFLEAMWFEVPVIALGGSAVDETVGSGGLIIDEKNPYVVAGLLHELFTDEAMSARFKKAGLDRLHYYSYPEVEKKMKAFLAPFLGT